jgi:hypothetical protein
MRGRSASMDTHLPGVQTQPMSMNVYDYIKRTYPVSPEVGSRVTHQVTKRSGTIARENVSQAHYVMVKFDGQKFSSPCHPTELDYLSQSKP